MTQSIDDKSTLIRANQSTINAMRLAAGEIGLDRQEFYMTDNDRLAALVNHWHTSKHQSEARTARQEAA